MARNERHVVRHGNGWAVEKPNAERASSVHPTQKEAIDRGREIVQKSGGGELVIHGMDGHIRDSDTIPPGNDPFPPRDTK